MIGRLPPLTRWSLRDSHSLPTSSLASRLLASRPRPTLPFLAAEACPLLGKPRSPEAAGLRGPAPEPAQSGRPGCRSLSPTGRLRRGRRGSDPYLSGLFPGPAAVQLQEPMSVRGGGGPAPLPGAGARIPGRGLGTRAALASSHAPRPAPGRGRTAPPPAPAHRLTPALTHTHTPSRARTHALPSLLLCLSPPAVWGPRRNPALRLRHAVSAPAPSLTLRGYATAMAPGSFQNTERGP